MVYTQVSVEWDLAHLKRGTGMGFNRIYAICAGSLLKSHKFPAFKARNWYGI